MARRTVDDLLQRARRDLVRIGPEEAMAALREGARLVDIRSEVQRAHDGTVPGSHFLARNVLEWRMDPDSGHADPVLSSDLDAHVIVMCNEGYQSSLAAATLQELGFRRATDLDGGYLAWRAAGLPVDP